MCTPPLLFRRHPSLDKMQVVEHSPSESTYEFRIDQSGGIYKLSNPICGSIRFTKGKGSVLSQRTANYWTYFSLLHYWAGTLFFPTR